MMIIIRELFDSPWEFTLYETDEFYVLNVDFCNSFVDYTVSYKITDEESQLDFRGIKKLADKIRQNPDLYREREVPLVTKY